MPKFYLNIVSDVKPKAEDNIRHMEFVSRIQSPTDDWRDADNDWVQKNKNVEYNKILESEQAKVIYDSFCNDQGFYNYETRLEALKLGEIKLFPVNVYILHYNNVTVEELKAINKGYTDNNLDNLTLDDLNRLVDEMHDKLPRVKKHTRSS